MTTATDKSAGSDARPRPGRRRWGRRLLVFAGVPYVCICLIVFLVQRRLIYHPTHTDALVIGPGSIGNARSESVRVTTADGLQLSGWLVRSAAPGGPPQSGAAKAKPMVLFFHGNGGDRSYRFDTLGLFAGAGADVLIFDYRGYAENAGKPTEEGLACDARASWQYATGELGLKPGQIFLYGESLGGGVAMRLAAEMCAAGNAPAGVIASSSFSSLEDVAAWHFPWLPARWLLHDRYPSARRAAQVTCPILLLHGQRDTIVPYEIGRRLYDACPPASSSGIPKRMVDLPSADHNDVLALEAPRFRSAVREFLAQLAVDTPGSAGP